MSNFADVLGSGVVVTGGTALLPGIAELGEDVLNLPVRIGKLCFMGRLYDVVRASTFSTAVGLVHQGAIEDAESARRRAIAAEGDRPDNWIGRFRDWIREAFA